MSFIHTGDARSATQTRRRRVLEWLTLAGTSAAFLFALAVAFGLISG